MQEYDENDTEIMKFKEIIQEGKNSQERPRQKLFIDVNETNLENSNSEIWYFLEKLRRPHSSIISQIKARNPSSNRPMTAQPLSAKSSISQKIQFKYPNSRRNLVRYLRSKKSSLK